MTGNSNKKQHHSALIYSQLNWEIRDQYLNIFKKFVENKISNSEFCEILKEKLRLNGELSDTVEFDTIHYKAEKFTDFLDDASLSCEICDPNPANFRLPGHISKAELREEIEKTFFELQKLLEA